MLWYIMDKLLIWIYIEMSQGCACWFFPESVIVTKISSPNMCNTCGYRTNKMYNFIAGSGRKRQTQTKWLKRQPLPFYSGKHDYKFSVRIVVCGATMSGLGLTSYLLSPFSGPFFPPLPAGRVTGVNGGLTPKNVRSLEGRALYSSWVVWVPNLASGMGLPGPVISLLLILFSPTYTANTTTSVG